jgi:hypothetical protein
MPRIFAAASGVNAQIGGGFSHMQHELIEAVRKIDLIDP